MENIYGCYDYERSEEEDIRDFIEGNIDLADYDSLEELKEELKDELWDEDSVTGIGSGSYTHSTIKAAEYLAYNFDLLADALDGFCEGTEVIREGAEACDVTIRCYLLNRCIQEVLDGMEDEFEKVHEENSVDGDEEE